MKKYTKTAFLLMLIGQIVACSSGIESDLTIKTDPNRYGSSEGTDPSPDPDPEPNPNQALKLPQELFNVAASNDIPGVQIAYVEGDQVESYVYGVTDLTSKTPLTEDHVFQAASVSKTVAAYVFLRLYDKGVFDLDRPLYEYYYYDRVAKANNPKNGLITARHVLAHLTGYPNWVGTVQSTAWWTSALEPGTSYTPGIDYRYSGEGFTFLQETLKHLTGKSLQQMAYEEVFEPFGMTSTSFEWLPEVFSGRNTRGHNAAGINDDPMTRWSERNANSAFTMITNAKDMAKFMQRGMFKGEGLRPETFDLLTTRASWSNGENNPNQWRGLGFVIHTNEKGMSLYHSGSNAGYLAYFIANLDQDEGVVVLTNKNSGGTNDGKEMAEAAFPFFLGNDQIFHMFD